MSQIVDGKAIAEKIYEDLAARIRAAKIIPALAVIYVGSDSVTDSFISIKRKFAEKIGIKVEIFRFENTATQEEVLLKIKEVAEGGIFHGIIVQLPLPASFSVEAILNAIPPALDTDMLSAGALEQFQNKKTERLPVLPAALKTILEEYRVNLNHKKIAIVGKGRLVGYPIYTWLKREGFEAEMLDSKDDLNILKEMDVVISGTGVSGLLKPSMFKPGVVLIDAGTSESSGKIAGDADPACAEVALLFTPVPGGVGPVTVAMLLRNLVDSAIG